MMASQAISPEKTRTNCELNCTPMKFKGDTEAAFETLYVRYRRRLFLVAFGILKNSSDAEDAVQDSMLRAYTKIDSFRGDSAIYTWLVRIVINTSLMVLRKRSRVRDVSLDCDDDEGQSWADRLAVSGLSAETQAINRQRQELMLNAIANLPPKYKGLVLEWVERERTMAELSDQFGIPMPTVKSRVLRAKERVAGTVNRRLNAVSFAPPVRGSLACNFPESNPKTSHK